MPVIINGNGTVDTGTVLVGNSDITGLAAGALPSTVIGAGAVLQVVSATYNTQSESSATAWIDTGLSVSITPTSSSSKVLVIASLPARNGSTSDTNGRTTIFRGSTNIGDSSFGFGILKTTDTAVHSIMTMNYLDSPATTSSTTYKVSVYPGGAQFQWCGGGSVAVITVMEIAA